MKTSVFFPLRRIVWMAAIAILPALLAHASSVAMAQAADVIRVDAGYSSPGPFAVAVADAVWRDEQRARDLPLRILSPQPSDKPAATATRYPVIIFSHGLGGSREGGDLWGRHWASHGYIVVHLQHPGSDESIWKDKKPAERLSNMKSAMNLDNSRLRIDDVKFAIDEMLRMQAAGLAPFASADLAHVGMSGHSFGAQTTLAIAGQQLPFPGAASSHDERISAAIAFSPNARIKIGLDKQFGDMALPMLQITGTKDGSILGDGTRYEDRLLPYEKMPPGKKYLLSFIDGDHMVFGGHMLGGRRPETARDREIQLGVKAATLAFWNATLKQDGAARRWLEQRFQSTLTSGDRFSFK